MTATRQLADGAPLRLLLGTVPTAGDEDGLRHAMNRLRGVLTHRHRKLASRPSARP
jgi:hypothetical protein